MSQPINAQDIIQWLVALVGGGLAGSALAILFNLWNASRMTRSKEVSLLEALHGELQRSRLLCDHNAKLQAHRTAVFIRFPAIGATKATFEERHSYPSLASVIKQLEYYTLAVLQVNEMIDQYRLLIAEEGAPGYHIAADRDNLRNQIAGICAGSVDLKGTGPENFLRLPTFIDLVSSKVARIRGIELTP